MMSAFDIDFDYSKYDPDAVEKQVESGGNLPPGYYRAKLDGANPTTSKKKNTPCWELTFVVTDGPFTGYKMTEKLWDSDNPRMVNRILMFKHRLGVIQRNAESGKFERVAGITDFRDCMDREVIIHAIHELRFNEDKTPVLRQDGTQMIDVRLDFNGLFRPDDAKALEKVGKPVATAAAALAAPASTTATTPAPAARPAMAIEDL